jgi:hypothetical protein
LENLDVGAQINAIWETMWANIKSLAKEVMTQAMVWWRMLKIIRSEETS